jgi:hypothetical protein
MKKLKNLLIIFSLSLFILTPTVMAKTNKGNSSTKNRSASSNERLKGYEKPKDNVNTHAQIHKEKMDEVVSALEDIADDEGLFGNEDLVEALEELAEEEDVDIEEVADIIEEIEDQPGWKKFLLGTEYKNLGQLRSALVKNRNQIRKLNQNVEKASSEETKLMLQTQIETMTQERERIKDIIVEEESGFSLLGWLSKLLTGYKEEDLETEEEEELIDEVEEVLGISSSQQ